MQYYDILKLLMWLQVLNSRVQSVDPGSVSVVDKDDNESNIPFGACVWATGVAMNPLIKKLQSTVPEQNHFRALLTDEKLRVLGSSGSMWAIGDASTIAAPKALDYADELFDLADTDGNGSLSLVELRVWPACLLYKREMQNTRTEKTHIVSCKSRETSDAACLLIQ